NSKETTHISAVDIAVSFCAEGSGPGSGRYWLGLVPATDAGVVLRTTPLPVSLAGSDRHRGCLRQNLPQFHAWPGLSGRSSTPAWPHPPAVWLALLRGHVGSLRRHDGRLSGTTLDRRIHSYLLPSGAFCVYSSSSPIPP